MFVYLQESVLDEKKKSRVNQETAEFRIPNESVCGLHDSYTDLREAISKYEAIVDHIDHIWQEKVYFLTYYFLFPPSKRRPSIQYQLNNPFICN